jgi:hypothetical protein
MLVPCVGNTKTIVTNRDLADAYLEDQKALATCNGQLKAIQELPPPATK